MKNNDPDQQFNVMTLTSTRKDGSVTAVTVINYAGTQDNFVNGNMSAQEIQQFCYLLKTISDTFIGAARGNA